jgi:hypothetical protein
MAVANCGSVQQTTSPHSQEINSQVPFQPDRKPNLPSIVDPAKHPRRTHWDRLGDRRINCSSDQKSGAAAPSDVPMDGARLNSVCSSESSYSPGNPPRSRPLGHPAGLLWPMANPLSAGHPSTWPAANQIVPCNSVVWQTPASPKQVAAGSQSVDWDREILQYVCDLFHISPLSVSQLPQYNESLTPGFRAGDQGQRLACFRAHGPEFVRRGWTRWASNRRLEAEPRASERRGYLTIPVRQSLMFAWVRGDPRGRVEGVSGVWRRG